MNGISVRNFKSVIESGAFELRPMTVLAGINSSGKCSPQVICTDRIELSPDGPVVAVNIPAGQWHTVKALESGTVIIEMKNGPYEPITDADILSL